MARTAREHAERRIRVIVSCACSTHALTQMSQFWRRLTNQMNRPLTRSDCDRSFAFSVLDACRDAANGWVFPEAGPPCTGIRDAYVAAANPTHFVDVTATIDAGIASLREHRAYLEGLGRDFDPDEFLRNMAGFTGLGAGCEYAVGFRRYPMG